MGMYVLSFSKQKRPFTFFGNCMFCQTTQKNKLSDEEGVSETLNLFQALDTAVGEIYDALKRTGIYENSGI